jgi:hypothetical protein
VLLLALCGCSSVFGLHEPTRGSVDGAPSDATECLGTGMYTVCFDAPPTDAQRYSGTLNTTTIPCATNVHWVSPAQPDACFLAGTDVMLENATIVGARPLVVVATGTITLGGLVDASSHRASPMPGAGAGSPACGTPGPATQDNAGGAGGAGGSYGTLGGNGGSGASATAGGTAVAAGPIASLHGGCPGAPGAKGGGGAPGTPGLGGGAVYFVAGGSIALGTSTLAANGAGAGISANRWGGSGGGTGGMIVLSAPAITASSATLMANGGGGASGTNGGVGMPGSDPSTSSPHSPAQGGVGMPPGGNGYALSAAAGDGGPSPGGTTSGGGGGGGAGYIRATVPISGADASPPIDVVP